jgi:pimeloyl-ACP methyl ester carboxylesterase
MTLRRTTILLRDGFRVGVTTGGAGIPLVFLHGLSVSATAYTEMLELLADNGFDVIALDAADHGRSDALPFGHTVADMAAVTAEALEQLGVGPAVLVGHSMGGAMVAEFAARHPGRVIAAILLDAAVGEEHHAAVRVDPSPGMLWRGARLLSGAVRDLLGDAYQATSMRPAAARAHLVGQLRRSVSGLDCLKAVVALMRSDTAPALAAMKRHGVHTVLVHGTRDGIVPFEAALSASLAIGARLHLLPGRYHSWMIADPALAVDVVWSALETSTTALAA